MEFILFFPYLICLQHIPLNHHYFYKTQGTTPLKPLIIEYHVLEKRFLYMRIEIEMKDETYEKIKNVIDWINLDNSFRGRSDTPEAKIEDFIKGAAISKLLDVEAMSPVLNSEGLDSLEVKNRFKDIAKEKKIRQVDICKRTGLKKANLSLIFNNEKTLRAETFFAIWLALGCPPIHECLYIKKSD